jgi:hypothetical protein
MLERDLRESPSPQIPPLPARSAVRPSVLDVSVASWTQSPQPPAQGCWQAQWAGPGAGGRPRYEVNPAVAELSGDTTPTAEKLNTPTESNGVHIRTSLESLQSPTAATAATDPDSIRRPSGPHLPPRNAVTTSATGLSKSTSTRETTCSRPALIPQAPRKYSLPCDVSDRSLSPAAGDARQRRACTLDKLDDLMDVSSADNGDKQPIPQRSLSPCPTRPLPAPPLPARSKMPGATSTTPK